MDRRIAATPAQPVGTCRYQDRIIRYEAWHNRVTTTTKVDAGNPTISLFVFYDPYYKKSMTLVTDIFLTAQNLYLVYRVRWPVEQPPLAAKQMFGLHRQFVFSDESRFRLPELALLAGNVFTHLAACGHRFLGSRSPSHSRKSAQTARTGYFSKRSRD